MIHVAKGKYTSYMAQQNNLLICKKFEGNKVQKAVHWGIDVVNHLWLQDIWFGRNLKELTDTRYQVCDNKEAVELDYTLTKDLMVGWKVSLKLNEQDQKRLSEFKEASLSRSWKKPTEITTSVLVSKENIIDNSLTSSNSNQLSSILNLNNTKSTPQAESNNNKNSNSLNEMTTFQSPLHNTNKTSTPTTTLTTFVISNQTDTLTIVTVSSCSEINKTTKSPASVTTAATTNTSIIKTERNTDSYCSAITNDQKFIDELSIKKEKVDFESMDISNNSKVPATNSKDNSDSNLMEIDSINNNLSINKTITSNILASSTDSIITQSTSTKPSLIEIKPNSNNLNEDSNTKTDSLISSSLEKSKNELTNATSNNNSSNNTTNSSAIFIQKSTTVDVCAATTTAAFVNSDRIELKNDSTKETTNLVNGDLNSNEKQSIADVEMMEVESKNDSSLLKKEELKEDDSPSAKRMKLSIKEEKIDVQSDSIDSKKEDETAIAKDNLLINGLDKEEDTSLKKSKWLVESIKVFFTNVPNSKELSEIVASLGGKLVNNYADCTHLISSKVERTIKFVCSFNYAHFILKPEWLIKSKESGYFLNESDYFLNDQLNEEHFGFTIKESFERRAKRDSSKLIFQDFIFFITRSCVPSFKILIQIIRSAGGTAVVKKIPSAAQIDIMKQQNKTKFLVITCEKDLHLCNLFYEKEIRKLLSLIPLFLKFIDFFCLNSIKLIYISLSSLFFYSPQYIAVLHSEFVLSNILKQTIEYKPFTIEQN